MEDGDITSLPMKIYQTREKRPNNCWMLTSQLQMCLRFVTRYYSTQLTFSKSFINKDKMQFSFLLGLRWSLSCLHFGCPKSLKVTSSLFMDLVVVWYPTWSDMNQSWLKPHNWTIEKTFGDLSSFFGQPDFTWVKWLLCPSVRVFVTPPARPETVQSCLSLPESQ